MYEVGETGASDGSHYEKRVDARGRESEPVCIDDEIPFEIPEGWAWCRFSSVNLGSFTGPFGSALHKSDYVSEGIPVVNPADIIQGHVVAGKMVSPLTRDRLSSYVLASGDFIIGRRGEMGRAAIITDDEDGWLCGTGCFFAHMPQRVIPNYWRLLFSSPLVVNQLESKSVGTTMKNLNLDILGNLLIPIPPHSEQARICSHAFKAFEMITQYGAFESARERLDAELPDRLRKSILQLAVKGELVEQDPDDEPASVLLDRIRAERAKLIKEKKIRAPKGGESVIWRASDGGYYEKRGNGEPQPIEVPFDIPDSWAWTRLKSLGEIVGGGTPKTHDASLWASPGDGTPWITPADMKNVHGRRVSHGGRYLSEKGLAGSSAKLMPAGTVVMSSRAPIGYLAITECPIATNQGFKSIVPTLVDTNAWIMLALDALMDDIKKRASGTTFKEISGTEFGDTLVPLPPLSEQARIVACSESVMAAIG